MFPSFHERSHAQMPPSVDTAISPCTGSATPIYESSKEILGYYRQSQDAEATATVNTQAPTWLLAEFMAHEITLESGDGRLIATFFVLHVNHEENADA